MKLNDVLVEIFTTCERCGELVPSGNYCSKCGARHRKQIEARALTTREQTICQYCNSHVWKEAHCSNCGFLLVRED